MAMHTIFFFSLFNFQPNLWIERISVRFCRYFYLSTFFLFKFKNKWRNFRFGHSIRNNKKTAVIIQWLIRCRKHWNVFTEYNAHWRHIVVWNSCYSNRKKISKKCDKKMIEERWKKKYLEKWLAITLVMVRDNFPHLNSIFISQRFCDALFRMLHNTTNRSLIHKQTISVSLFWVKSCKKTKIVLAWPPAS